jgi:FO synthase subunit 2
VPEPKHRPCQVQRRAREAVALGATEVCAQAGLPPAMARGLYEDIAAGIKEAAPGVHLHAFSPEEVRGSAGICIFCKFIC